MFDKNAEKKNIMRTIPMGDFLDSYHMFDKVFLELVSSTDEQTNKRSFYYSCIKINDWSKFWRKMLNEQPSYVFLQQNRDVKFKYLFFQHLFDGRLNINSNNLCTVFENKDRDGKYCNYSLPFDLWKDITEPRRKDEFKIDKKLLIQCWPLFLNNVDKYNGCFLKKACLNNTAYNEDNIISEKVAILRVKIDDKYLEKCKVTVKDLFTELGNREQMVINLKPSPAVTEIDQFYPEVNIHQENANLIVHNLSIDQIEQEIQRKKKIEKRKTEALNEKRKKKRKLIEEYKRISNNITRLETEMSML